MSYEILFGLYNGVHVFIRLLTGILFVYALMTWFVRPDSKIYRVFYNFCSPIVAPFRGISEKLIRAGLRVDLSVWMAMIALRIIDNLLLRLILAIL